jgi:hypothetical protein
MTHDEFFMLAIDPDPARVKALTPEKLREIEAHRSECPECAGLERDFGKIMSEAGARDGAIPAIPPEVDSLILAIGRRDARRNRLKRWLPWILLGILAVAAPLVAWSIHAASSAASPDDSFDHDRGVAGPDPVKVLAEATSALDEARAKNDPSRARDALGLFRTIESSVLAVYGKLGAAKCLLLLGRKEEARAELDAVVRDPRATDAQREEAAKLR